MQFLSTEHQEHFLDLLQKAKVTKDTERESLFYIISGNKELYKNLNKLYDFQKNQIKIEINEEGKICIPNLPVSSSAKALAYLGLQLFNNCNNQSVMETFRNLDSNNFKLAIYAIKLRFGM